VAVGRELPAVPGFVPHSGHQPPDANPADPIAERNRQNAQHSTGPRTEEGKARSARNALKHGLSMIQRYRGHWDRRHQRAIAEFDRAQRARHSEAQEQRRQAEEHRREELHKLRIAQARIRQEKEQSRLENQQAQTAAKQAKAKESAFFKDLEKHLHAPPPIEDKELLAKLGFVSSGERGEAANLTATLAEGRKIA